MVILIDAGVLRWAHRVSEHLDESRVLITEKVFGFLLAAIAVQLALNGRASAGVIHLNLPDGRRGRRVKPKPMTSRSEKSKAWTGAPLSRREGEGITAPRTQLTWPRREQAVGRLQWVGERPESPPDRSLRTPQPPSLVALTLQRRRLTHALQQPRDER